MLCPCKYPFETLKKGITKIAKETQRITNVTSEMVFPPCKSPKIKEAKLPANKNNTIKAATEIKLIIFLATLYALTLASIMPKVLYSLIILLIATGSPAEDISKKIT